jgi:dephospho-CoA kinase
MSSPSLHPPASSPLLIALTGGIASGKSAVADIFSSFDVPVLDTDLIARQVVQRGSRVLEELVAAFGSDILDASGNLDRARMRERVFEHVNDRARLEEITHPAIRAELVKQSRAAGGPYQVHVIPLLVEKARAQAYDRVVVVDCPEEDQVKRLAARDGSSPDQARKILEAQASREQRLAIADDGIVNNGTLEDLKSFVETLHKNYSLVASYRDKTGSLPTR